MSPNGLFPLPMSYYDQVNGLTPKLYRDIGKLVAKSLIDSRLINLPFNALFFRWILGEGKFFNYKKLEQLDGDLSRSFNSLRRIVDALCLDFTIPALFKLGFGGCTGVSKGCNGTAMESFREVFECVFPISNLSLFHPEELALLLCGEPDIDDA
uniref:E3 ubiquitin-protein ligase n=1 Tax=Daphnia galeata TaxID=27404 RepID=A0A8J2RU31_9CRUS|nr:unnamed protein product [Daphnia galeata]